MPEEKVEQEEKVETVVSQNEVNNFPEDPMESLVCDSCQ